MTEQDTAQKSDIDSTTSSPVLVLLRRQAALFEQLDRLSEKQSGAVAQGAADELLTVLSTRQRFTEELRSIQEQIEPYRNNWTAVRGSLQRLQADEAEQLLGRSSELLGRILGRDDRDRVALEQAQGQIGAELSRMNQVGKARAAYGGGGGAANANLYTNRQG